MGKTLLFTVFICLVAVSIWLVDTLHLKEKYVKVTGGSLGEKYYGLKEDNKVALKFDLVDPETAPETTLTKILYGYHLMLNTKEHAPEYCGNTLSCNNCHFNGGNSLGGKNRGISLVGVTAVYPRFSKRDNKSISLSDRLNNCFLRSMNGSPPPKTSLEMESLISYLAWISHEVDKVPNIPWLGLGPIQSEHVPDAKHGGVVYTQNCSICHGKDGEGTEGVPPLWGSNSFNDGAGMNTLPMLSSFVWLNMPYGQPTLTKEEALDVAAYISTKPRPHFEAVKK